MLPALVLSGARFPVEGPRSCQRDTEQHDGRARPGIEISPASPRGPRATPAPRSDTSDLEGFHASPAAPRHPKAAPIRRTRLPPPAAQDRPTPRYRPPSAGRRCGSPPDCTRTRRPKPGKMPPVPTRRTTASDGDHVAADGPTSNSFRSPLYPGRRQSVVHHRGVPRRLCRRGTALESQRFDSCRRSIRRHNLDPVRIRKHRRPLVRVPGIFDPAEPTIFDPHNELPDR